MKKLMLLHSTLVIYYFKKANLGDGEYQITKQCVIYKEKMYRKAQKIKRNDVSL